MKYLKRLNKEERESTKARRWESKETKRRSESEQWPKIKRPLHFTPRRSPTHARPLLQYVPTLRMTRMQEYCVCAAHGCNNKQMLRPVVNALSNGQKKGRVAKFDDLPYLTHQRHVHHEQLDKSRQPILVQARGLTSHIDLQFTHTRWGYHTQHRTTLVHTWGLDKLVTLCLSRLLIDKLVFIPNSHAPLL